MPLQEQEKLQAFSEKVIGEANKEASAMAEETYQHKKESVAAGKAKIAARVKAKYALKLKKILDEHSFALSTATLEKNKEYLAKRDEITERVLQGVRHKVELFVQSEQYLPYLEGLCRQVGEIVKERFIVSLSAQDMKYKEKVKTAAGALCADVVQDDEAFMGGARFYAESGGIVINETLDENLEHCRDDLMVLMGKYLRAAD
ncbi:MAG: hypothetical protein HFE77_05980 [Clostridiales bacterium]|nr:hypothetical protein [Clostridiales bacterium]